MLLLITVLVVAARASAPAEARVKATAAEAPRAAPRLPARDPVREPASADVEPPDELDGEHPEPAAVETPDLPTDARLSRAPDRPAPTRREAKPREKTPTRPVSPKVVPEPALVDAVDRPPQTLPTRPSGRSVAPEDEVRFLGHAIESKKLVFVIDTSSSMAPVMPRVTRSLESALGAMTDEHSMTIVTFADRARRMSQKLLPASRRAQALRFVRRSKPAAHSNPLPALRAAMRIADAESVVFVTNGSLTAAECEFLSQARKAGKRELVVIPIAPSRRVRELLASWK